ncbi:class II glutamine amidotransferase [Mycolicibacterium sp. 018/SC-01/001]|uniref:class II glutamine amidotransferase n=1 Tax=Mycolicibacterium sp. 018/SC-01/001 TaxID=2592069 RepID=UPI00117E8241|nr:class II glutamine amidotransferase [Mycolicibacterium sp. 018/SC-01/001]TRW78409.1 class II glutamine amidotransferase [Mycolicibacterium sp. 018/SC-01/001]
MCRLFGMHAGAASPATFWLLDAPDSLAEQSRRNPDGTGLGYFDTAGVPVVRKQPLAAWRDAEFAREARDVVATTVLAHVRYASTGAPDVANTHPFVQDSRLFAHNGVVTDLDALDTRLADMSTAELVGGQTDSERVFALITGAIRARDGDVTAGIVDAVHWLGAHVGIYALNILLCTATEMWALRYPDTHDLFVLDRRVPADHSRFEMRSSRINARSTDGPSVVFATERMDDDPAWRPIGDGELVHVGPDLALTSTAGVFEPPRHRLTVADLNPAAAASQIVR